MTLQKIFFMFLVLGFVSSGYFSIQTTGALIEYFTLSEKALARIARWEIKQRNEKFPIKADYSFELNGAFYQGATQFAKPWHLNEPSAVAALREMAAQEWFVWFNPKNPKKSSLEKNFPSGLIVRTLICYGVFVYFIILFRKPIKNNYN